MRHFIPILNGDVAAASPAREVAAPTHSLLAYWHLLSLDAPCVAALWTVYLARMFRIMLPWTAPLALALAVWMVYAADRLADAAAGKALEERHHFHQRHRAAFAACWLCSAPVLLLLVFHLPHALRDGWLLLAIPLAAYVAAVHALQVRHVPKEPFIGLFFGVAVAMPLVNAGLPAWSVARVAALFALLCWLNCAAIAAWEVPWSEYVDPATRFLGGHLRFSAVAAIVLLFSMATHAGPSRGIGVALAACTVLLLILQQHRARLSRLHVRALADAALLAPLVVWPLLAWLTP